jgi:hypothetical protein
MNAASEALRKAERMAELRVQFERSRRQALQSRWRISKVLKSDSRVASNAENQDAFRILQTAQENIRREANENNGPWIELLFDARGNPTIRSSARGCRSCGILDRQRQFNAMIRRAGQGLTGQSTSMPICSPIRGWA